MLPRLHLLRKGMRHLRRQVRRFSSDSPRPLVVATATTKVSPQKANPEPPLKAPVVVERKERVINLDTPRDLRTPLPGSVGFCLRPFTGVIQLSKISGATTVNNLLKDYNNPSLVSKSEGERLNINGLYEKRDPLVMAADHLECQIHDCPDLVKRDFEKLFPRYNLSDGSFTAIMFSHKTESDMSIWSEEMEQERGDLVTTFKNAAQELCLQLADYGYWVEYVDPHNGTMRNYITDGGLTSAALYETDDRYRHFGLDIQDLGCCKVVSHHRWGTNTFVGSVFTNAPAQSDILRHLAVKYMDLFNKKP